MTDADPNVDLAPLLEELSAKIAKEAFDALPEAIRNGDALIQAGDVVEAFGVISKMVATCYQEAQCIKPHLSQEQLRELKAKINPPET